MTPCPTCGALPCDQVNTTPPAAADLADLVRRLEHEAAADALSEKRWLNESAKLKTEAVAAITALSARLGEIKEIASWEARDKEAYIAQGPGILIRDMRRIASLASEDRTND